MKKRPISKYWRLNRSRHEATELALGLRGIRKAAGHFGSNVKPVFWKGMAAEDNRSIILDPGILKGNYPIPHALYDVLVGQVVLEGFYSMEFGEWVKSRALASVPDSNEHFTPYLERIVDAADSIYISELVKPFIWSRYLKRFLDDFSQKEKRDPRLPPTPGSLSNAWRDEAILGQSVAQRHFNYDEPLRLLEGYANRIRAVVDSYTITQRRENRISIYGQMCRDLQKVLSQWEIMELNPDGVNLPDQSGPKGNVDVGEDETEKTQAEEVSGDMERFSKGLDPELADDVSVILEEGALAQQSVAVALQEPGARSMETLIQNGEVKTDIKPDREQVRRMKKIFKKQELLIRRVSRKNTRRGLSEGKLDSIRLYRVPLDGKVFKNKQSPGKDYNWQICIVADASASMSGKGDTLNGKNRLRRPWEIAEKSFVSLAAASKGHRNHLDIYAYRAERNVCHLTKLYHGNELYSVTPAGRTPSGQAIKAAAALLDKTFKKSMIVHITDGAANCGLSLADALDYCRKSGIDVFTLGCGCNQQTRDFLREFFSPGHLYFLKSVHHLADGLEHLFRHRILDAIR